MKRYCYADPPYPKQAARHYSNDPSGIPAQEVDHAALVAQLCRDFPDGWALSTSSSALRGVLVVCPPDVRVGSWVKTFASFKPGVNPAYAWEPVIFWRGRKLRSRKEPTVRDWIATPITTKRGTHGAKPETECFWLFEMLGMQPGDLLHDMYPGSGAVGQAWQKWQRQLWTA